MADSSPARTNRSHATAAEVAAALDQDFKSHPKFQQRSSVFTSKTPRFKKKIGQGPGPATYSPSVASGQRNVILDTRAARSKTVFPATEATYDAGPSSVVLKKPASRRGSSSFASLSPRGKMRYSDTPDCTQYNKDQTATTLIDSQQQQQPSAVFRSVSPRMGKPTASQSPSPASYSPTVASGVPAGHTASNAVFRSSCPRLSYPTSNTPGPGVHATKSVFDAAATKQQVGTNSFRSRSPRLSFRHSDTPAPGTYDQDQPSSTRGISLSRTPRSVSVPAQGPSPASYAARGAFEGAEKRADSSGPFRSRSPRFKENHHYPSGMTHEVVDFSKASAKSGRFVSRAPRMTSQYNTNPGPGTYKVQGDSLGKNVVMGSSQRPNYTKGVVSPGPGTYQPTISSGGRSCTAPFRSGGRKMNERVSTTPGPGAHYDSASTTFNFTSARGTAFAKQTEPRFKRNIPDTPAPGHCIKAYSSFLD